ncbi:MAG: NAD-dependent epimerase/dehydratase family protein [Candidatus Undinarchaeales archaeon]
MGKTLITGGAGFIGHELTRQLAEDGEEVIVFDNFINFIPPEKSKYEDYVTLRMEKIKDKATIVRGDVRYRSSISKAIDEHKPDTVVHTAALPIATTSAKYPDIATDINLGGTNKVLDSIINSDSVERFIFTSSSMTYGNFIKPTADEKHPKHPLGIYGGTKLCGEILTKSYCKEAGIDYIIIVPSAVYGPTDSNRRVSQIFIDNAMEEKPLILHDGGESKLDFSYIKDVANGFKLAVQKKAVKNETFNITRGEGRKIKEFAEILKKYFPDLEIKVEPSKHERPERGSLDISKAKKLLGYEPEYSLEEGIKEYVEFVKKHQ